VLKASLKSLLAHKLRLALSTVAIVLGVAFVAGSLIFTDTLSRSFDSLFQETASDITVTQKSSFEGSDDFATGGKGVPGTLIAKVRQVEGIEAVEGQLFVDGVQIIGKNGKVVGTAGPPSAGIDWSDTPGVSAARLAEGRAPKGENEVVIDSATAEKAGFAVGDSTRVLTPRKPVQVTITGIFKFGESGNTGGSVLVAFDRAAGEKLLGTPGYYASLGARVADGVSQDEVRDRVAAALGTDYQVKTKQEQADSNARDVEQGLQFINIFLLVFAGVALFVGSFIILNTFSMLVAQRTRELALLRAVGASRRQVTRSVLVEAFVMGIVGSTLGLAAGFGLALGLKAAFGAMGIELAAEGLVFSTRAVVWSYIVGIVVTTVAAYFPARRAAKVPPVAAMRDDVAMPTRSLHRRTLVGAVLTALGAAGLAVGLGPASGSTAAYLVGLSAMVVLIGVAVLSPVLSVPVVKGLGAALPRMFGTVGRLSRGNALRNPRRTAATASALMIGLALVGMFSVVASSTTASVERTVDESLGSEFVLNSPSTFAGFSPEIAAKLRQTAGVESVTQQRFGQAQLDGKSAFLSAIDPAGLDRALKVQFTAGSAAGLSGSGLLVAENVAGNRGWAVGDRVPLLFRDGTKADLTVAGVYKANQAVGETVVSLDTLAKGGGPQRDQFLYVSAAVGADTATVKKNLETAVSDYPNVVLQDQSGFKENQRKQVNQLLYFIYGLLALSIIIAVLGIVNTLALSVIERTHEIGLLRAVGMSRRQLRRMVRLESVVISVFGAVLGLLIGVGFGVALQPTLADQGIGVLSVPGASLAGFVVVAAIIGVLAAVWPARRAARLDVLRAITTE
jgi:putative ABC transport system permease protein